MTTSQDVDTRQLLVQMIGGYWITQAIYVSAELGSLICLLTFHELQKTWLLIQARTALHFTDFCAHWQA